MNIPLPTDNLYKFMALFDLTMIIAGLFFIYKEVSFCEDFNLKKNLENINSNATEEERKLRRKRVECEIANINKAFSNRTKPIGYSLGIGIVLTSFGFILWYFKLQRYQDMIEKKKQEEKRERKNRMFKGFF